MIIKKKEKKNGEIDKFGKLTSENFAVRLAQWNLATKAVIADIVEKTDFDDKLKNLIKKITSNKTKRV